MKLSIECMVIEYSPKDELFILEAPYPCYLDQEDMDNIRGFLHEAMVKLDELDELDEGETK